MMQVYPLQNKGLVMMNRITVVVFAFVPLMEAQFASQIRLPNTPDITAHFGVHKGRIEVLMAFLLGFISIISSLLLLFMKALTTNDCFVFFRIQKNLFCLIFNHKYDGLRSL
jgi:hypothetical protein